MDQHYVSFNSSCSMYSPFAIVCNTMAQDTVIIVSHKQAASDAFQVRSSGSTISSHCYNLQFRQKTFYIHFSRMCKLYTIAIWQLGEQ